MQKGDVLLGDRNYLRPAAVRAALKAEAHVLLRLRWTHSPMRDAGGREFHALSHATRLKVGQVGEWPVTLVDPAGTPIEGRVVATKLPAPVAAKAERRAAKTATKKGKVPDPRSLPGPQGSAPSAARQVTCGDIAHARASILRGAWQ